VVRLVVGTACRWQSRKEEGEENLQEREKERERERERGTGGVCFAAGEEFRLPLVVETVMKRRW